MGAPIRSRRIGPLALHPGYLLPGYSAVIFVLPFNNNKKTDPMPISKTILSLGALASLFVAMIGFDAISNDRSKDEAVVMVFFFFLLFALAVAGLFNLWLPRVFAVGVTTSLFLLLHKALSQPEYFVVRNLACPSRVDTIWPTLFLSFIGLVSLNYSIWSNWLGPLGANKPGENGSLHTLKRLAWWVLFLAGLSGLVTLFYDNLTWEVFRHSMVSAGKGIGVVVLAVGGLIGLVWLFSLPNQRKMKRVWEEYKAIPDQVKEKVMQAIDMEASKGGWVLIHRPQEITTVISPTASKTGGLPYIEAPSEWPTDSEGKLGQFLIQLRLSSPRLGQAWLDRLVAVYLSDWELVIRSYDKPDAGLCVEMYGLQPETSSSLTFVPLRIPFAAVEEESDEEAFELLLRHAPSAEEILRPYTKTPEAAFAYILGGRDRDKNRPELHDFVLEGGDPVLIQGPHNPTCQTCGKPMRFLFQFPDFTDGLLLGDSGVGYVYGCDDHPDQCVGFIDCF